MKRPRWSGPGEQRTVAADQLVRLAAVLLMVAGCAHERVVTSRAPDQAPAPGAVTTAEPPPPPPSQQNPAAQAVPSTDAPAPPLSPVPNSGSAPSPVKAPGSPKSSAHSAPSATALTAAAPGSAAKGGAPSGSAATPPALDLKALEQRLRDTNAIGVFTKLSIKNQVDDLLAEFKAYHQGQSRLTLPQLRQKYEVLLIKVVTLLQDNDPSLARAVSSSREAIWGVLSDPKQFANI
jgi:hypothetical protein